jgi:hypothetical protein
VSQRCYVCARHPIQSDTVQAVEPPILRVNCPRCGVYDIAHKFIAAESNGTFWTEERRLTISHAIRKATDAHGRFTEVLNHEAARRQGPLPDPVEQADILIDSIARRCSYGAMTPVESTETWAARVGLKGKEQLFIMQKALASLTEQHGLNVIAIGDNAQFTLTLDGWKRARELRRERGPGNQAFVAMWFHADMKSAFDDGFAPALVDTGHQPYRVDLATHNNKIDDQIVAEIRRSKLVIVDATGARPNAYFEAGFAMGLGIPVIWCCNDSRTAPGLTSGTWTDNLPFDIRQHAFTFWSDAADLKAKLTNRIRALGFDPVWNRGQ